MYYYELYHHGIEGQRWGVRNGPPYPLKRGKLSKIKSKIKNRFTKVPETKEARNARKEKSIANANAKDILEFIPELDNAELINALNRVKWANELRSLADSKASKAGSKWLERVMNDPNLMYKYGTTIAKLASQG